ncbi:chromosome partitioning protein [Gammaproteobacteria bacterium]
MPSLETRPLVFSVSNRKGGTGKSTTAVNLAAEWAAQGLQTLLIDLDSQGHASLGVGVTPSRDQPTVHRIFQEADFALETALQATVMENLLLVPADQGFEHSGSAGDLLILRHQLNRPMIRERFDIVVLDTPPSLDFLLMNALAAAHGVIIPLIPHYLASEGVKQLARLFFRIASTVNPTLKLFGLLPVMVDPHIKLHRAVLADLKHQFGAARLLRGIRTDIHLAEAFAAHRPIRLHDPKGRGAMDYQLLASELLALRGLSFQSTSDLIC